MWICDNDHEEIVHDLTANYRPDCPLCTAREEIASLNEQMKELEVERDDLMDRVDALETDD